MFNPKEKLQCLCGKIISGNDIMNTPVSLLDQMVRTHIRDECKNKTQSKLAYLTFELPAFLK